jgi:hypothetical protein
MTISTLMLILLLTFGVACAFDRFAKSHHYRARGSRGLGLFTASDRLPVTAYQTLCACLKPESGVVPPALLRSRVRGKR